VGVRGSWTRAGVRVNGRGGIGTHFRARRKYRVEEVGGGIGRALVAALVVAPSRRSGK
jgi:hypothetical protein